MIRKALLGLLLLATGIGCAAQPQNAVATVRRVPVEPHLYQVLLSSAKHRAQEGGLAADSRTPEGARRLARIEVAALRTAIRDTALDALAGPAGVAVSKSDVDAAVARVEQAIGGDASLDGQLTAQGLTRNDFRTLTRYRLLESGLRQRQPMLDRAVAQVLQPALVQVYAAPCEQDHRYPQCLDAVDAT